MKFLLSIFSILLISNFALADSNESHILYGTTHSCEDSVTDWLVNFHSAETKSAMAKNFCSDFEGSTKLIYSCLNGAWNWVNSSVDAGHRYQVAFASCKKVRSYSTDSAEHDAQENSAVNSEVRNCLSHFWNLNSDVAPRDKRRLHAAKKCADYMGGH